jgi:glutaredoxin
MFTIYSKPNCSYCEQAKALLTRAGLPYEELILDVGQVKDPTKTYTTVPALKQRVPSAQTVPQIFHGDELVGGFEALKRHLSIAA